MDIIVSEDPETIEREEQYKAVFRTDEDKDEYLRRLSEGPIIGTYILTGSMQHCRQYIHLNMAEYGYVYVSPLKVDRQKTYDYIRMDRLLGVYSYEKDFYKVRRVNMNLVDIDNLRDTTLGKSAIIHIPELKPFLPYTVDFFSLEYTAGVFIVKIDSVDSYAGRGNFLVYDRKSYITARNKVKEKVEMSERIAKKRADGKNPLKGVVISKYIVNPLLDSRGHKIHFRCYVMITTWGEHKICPFFLTITAGKPYVKGNYDDPDIHDTHMRTTPAIMFFEGDERVFKGVQVICEAIVAAVSKRKVPAYKESRYGYQVLAPDIMFDANYKPYLLEINTTPLLGTLHLDGILEYEKRFSTWEFEAGIEPILMMTKNNIRPSNQMNLLTSSVVPYTVLINEDGAVVVHFKGWLQKYLNNQQPVYTTDQIYQILAQSLPYTRPNIRIHTYNGPTPRGQFAAGDHGMVAHNYSTTSVPMHVWDNENGNAIGGLRNIRDLIAYDSTLMQITHNAVPNSILVNFYETGKDNVGYHSDKELKDPMQTVYTITLGYPRTFMLKHKIDKRKTVKVIPEPGDLIVMTGKTQELWKHKVSVTSKKDVSGRISLTYRVL
jgi:hypothetical protein